MEPTNPPPAAGPPPGAPNPYGAPGQPPGTVPPGENPKARKLVRLSQWLGWGGLVFTLLIGPILGALSGVIELIFVLMGLGFASMVAGAIVGQVGRAMQGRVI